MQRTLVVTDVSGQAVGPIFNIQSLEYENCRLSRTSVTNYHCAVRNNPEERRSHVVMILETQREPNQNLAAAGQDSEFLLAKDGRSRLGCVSVCTGHEPTLSGRSHTNHRRIIVNSESGKARNFKYYHITLEQ